VFGTTYSETSAHIDTLEERLTNATLWNQDFATQGGSTFPCSASRLRSTGDDYDDGFTTAYFYRFLHQGLTSYLSCGMNFCSPKAVIRKKACEDLIQLISMAISPVTPQELELESDAGTHKQRSMMPFSFQLSHMDRLQLVRVCKDLAIHSDATAKNSSVKQLCESLFGFAAYVAHSDIEAAAAYEALVHVSCMEKDESSIQFEFKRLLQTLMESKSSHIINSTGTCLQEILLKYKGNKTKLYRFALLLLAKHTNVEINTTQDTENNKSSASNHEILTENAAKRQKLSYPDNNREKPLRLRAILKATRVLFSSTSNSALQKIVEGELDSEVVAATKQMIQNATVVLQCSTDDQLDIVKSASEFLALVLSYETTYLVEKSNVKYIFTYMRQSLSSANNEQAVFIIIDALRPLIVTCSRQSGTFAVSLLSFAIKTYSAQEKLIWKLATYISIGNPFVLSKRLSTLVEGSSDDEEIATYRIRTNLSFAHGRGVDASPSDTLQRCFSLAKSIGDMWVLFKLVRVAFQTSNYSFARAILENRLVRGCQRQQSFMWLVALSKLAYGEEVLAMNGTKGIPESLELLSSCNTLLTSLAAQNGKFNFQLEFMRLRLDTLNLIMITRSLCVETLMTEGTTSGKNNRSNLFRKNKSFDLLVSRYKKMHSLWGLHRCQQTRATLRTLQEMCQLLSEFTKYCAKDATNYKATAGSSSTTTQKYDQIQPMNIRLSKLRTDVFEQMIKSKQKDDFVSHASGFLLVMDAILKCQFPFPSAFFQMKAVPRAIVNISADPDMLSQNDDHDLSSVDAKSGAEIIDVVPGLGTKVILSGVVPANFIQTSNVTVSEIIACATLRYEGQLYEEDDAVDSDVGGTNGVTLEAASDETSTPLLPGGKFIMRVPFEPLLQEGYYRVKIDLGCRDVRGGKWIIPTSSSLEVIFRVDDEGSI